MKTPGEQPVDEKKQDWTETLPTSTGGQSVFDGMLTPEDAKAFAATSTSKYRLFNDYKAPGHRLPPLLLQSVARGEQDKAASILASCPPLLSHRGDVTDYSGRTFKNITAFQYALWAMDTHMCRMILDAIPPGPTGDALRADLIHQYEELEADGVTYELEGQTYTNQHHFDFSPLITALQDYVDHVDGWYNTQNWAEMERQWCTVVGLAQRYVPAHVAQEYCHPTRSFHPTPKFNERGLERSLTFHNYRNGTDMLWWPKVGSSSSVLGVDFGILRAELTWLAPAGLGPHRRALAGWIDLAAMTALCEVRTADLKQTLEILKHGPDPELGSGCVIS